jgi:transcriptional regulator with XRE-family HTH domain
MPHILPDVLKRLRAAKGWSLDQLAEKAKINKQTLHRLEKGEHGSSRENTIRKLARVYGVGQAVLTGGEKLPDAPDNDPPFLMSKLSFPISTSTLNALFLVGQRYHVPQSDIVELAPFLFCWAAEASLRKRRDRLQRAEAARDNARELEAKMRHLIRSDSEDFKNKINAERQSIEDGDLFGMSHDYYSTANDWTDNPFALFLDSLTEDMGEEDTFEGYGSFDYPIYRICADVAAQFADGDADLTDHILRGHLELNQMPKEIRDPVNFKRRAEWVQEKVQEFRNEMLKRFEHSAREEAST